MKFNKLIRDKVLENWNTKWGKNPSFHVATDEEYKEKLKEKLSEEVDEYLKDEKPEELADILEIIHALSKEKGLTFEHLEEIRLNKAKKSGSFQKRIILEDSED